MLPWKRKLGIEKTYRTYVGSYDRFPEVRQYVDRYENLFLIGGKQRQ